MRPARRSQQSWIRSSRGSKASSVGWSGQGNEAEGTWAKPDQRMLAIAGVPCAEPHPPEPESLVHLSQDLGAGWFSDPRTTPTVDEAQHNATAITAIDDPLIDTLRLVIGQQSTCRWGSRNRQISSWLHKKIHEKAQSHKDQR